MTFYADVICKSPLFRTTKQVSDPGMLEPVTRAAVQAIIADAKAMGHDLRLLETYRSKERQAVLFQRHATKLKQVGVHHFGLAADLGLYVNGKYEGRAEPYRFLIDLCQKHGLISGLDWGAPKAKHTFIDAGHVQRVTVKDQPRLFAGNWFPGADYAPTLA